VSVSYTKGDSHAPNQQEFDFVETGGPSISPNALIYGQPTSLIGDLGLFDPGTPSVPNTNATLNNMYLRNTDLTDEAYDYKADWKIPFTLTDDVSGKLSLGGKYHTVNRTSTNSRVFDYWQFGAGKAHRIDLINTFPFLYENGLNADQSANGPLAFPFVDPSYNRSNILGYSNGIGWNVYRLIDMMNTYSFTLGNVADYWMDGPNDYNQNYTDKETSDAGYIMGEFNIGSALTIVPGVRYQEERTDISAYHVYINTSNQTGLAGTVPVLVESKRDNPDWYPSVNFKYKLSDNIQFMGAAYKSVSLPSYSDVSPLVEYQQNVPIVAGNPYLKPSTAWNFDLGTSLFSNDVGLFTVDLFYKQITDLIYSIQNYQPFLPFPLVGAPADIGSRLPGTEYFDTTWALNNSGQNLTASIPMNDPAKAYLRGVEFSWQTHLWYLPGVLSGIVLDLNLSVMSSNQEYPYFSQVQVGGTPRKPIFALVYSTRTGSLQDQPKAIYNAILGWDYKGFSSRFSLRYQEKTLTSVDTKYELRDSYYDNVTLFDINLKQKLTDYLAVFADATNVNNHIDNYYLSHPAFATIAAGNLPTNQQTYGMNVQAGLSFTY
ncbi:MAG TPA: TonB-dependent receptor, partial [Bacteroidota bacterium]|nr:TonB-dependent receptor [Bacteroidota bacterium]